jgi:hypothetical protein
MRYKEPVDRLVVRVTSCTSANVWADVFEDDNIKHWYLGAETDGLGRPWPRDELDVAVSLYRRT